MLACRDQRTQWPFVPQRLADDLAPDRACRQATRKWHASITLLTIFAEFEVSVSGSSSLQLARLATSRVGDAMANCVFPYVNNFGVVIAGRASCWRLRQEIRMADYVKPPGQVARKLSRASAELEVAPLSPARPT